MDSDLSGGYHYPAFKQPGPALCPRVTSENARASCEAASGVSFAGLLAFDSRYPPCRELACRVSSCGKSLRITLFRQGDGGKCHGSKNYAKRVI